MCASTACQEVQFELPWELTYYVACTSESPTCSIPETPLNMSASLVWYVWIFGEIAKVA